MEDLGQNFGMTNLSVKSKCLCLNESLSFPRYDRNILEIGTKNISKACQDLQ